MKPSLLMRASALLLAAWLCVGTPPSALAAEDLDTRIREGLASVEQQRQEIRDYERWLNDTAERILIPNPFSLPVMVPPEQLWAAITLNERERAILEGRPFDPAAVAERIKLARDMSNALRAELRVRIDDIRKAVSRQEAETSALMDERKRLDEQREAAASPTALKDAFNEEIKQLLGKWDKKWCGPDGGSGCGLVPLNVFNGLRYSVPWQPTQRQIDALRNRAQCLDDCVMNYIGQNFDQQRNACIAQCDAQYPVPD